MLVKVFQAVLGLQAAVLLTQALLAGLALSGVNVALDAHRLTGAASLLVAIVQVAIVVLLWRARWAQRWLVAANVGFLLAEVAQAGAGYRHLWSLHLPLGAGMFGAAIAMALRARPTLQRAP